jgi:protein-tyrosine-phosphatase
MAEAFGHLYGNGKVEVYSAGSRPSGKINPRAVEFMKELGCDLKHHISKSLLDLPDGTFDCAVTMGCGDECPNVPAVLREDWAIEDPKHLPPEEFRRIRDIIGSKVKRLITFLMDE